MTIKFEDFLIEELRKPEAQREWLRLTIMDYIENGDENEFFRCLKYVIKARTTVSDFAKKIDMNRVQLVDILHGKTKSPGFRTISKILSGLGYTFDVVEKSNAGDTLDTESKTA